MISKPFIYILFDITQQLPTTYIILPYQLWRGYLECSILQILNYLVISPKGTSLCVMIWSMSEGFNNLSAYDSCNKTILSCVTPSVTFWIVIIFLYWYNPFSVCINIKITRILPIWTPPPPYPIFGINLSSDHIIFHYQVYFSSLTNASFYAYNSTY